MPDLKNIASWLSPRRISVLYLLLFINIAFALTIPDLFFSEITFQMIARSQAVVGIVALAALLPFVAGEFDISLGTNLAMSAVLVAVLSNDFAELGMVAICVIAILASTIVGVLNGFLVGKLGINSFIATLGTSQVLMALSLYISNNEQVNASLSPAFKALGQGRFLGVPNSIFVTLGVALLVWYVLRFTKLGRHLYAAGFNREAARLSGVRTERLVIGSYVAAGAIAGLGGVVYIGQVGTFSNAIGMPFLFPAYAALFLGATQFSQRPNVWGTILSIFTLALGVQGLQMLSSGSGFWMTPLFNGLALVAAVIFARQQSKVRSKVTDADYINPTPDQPVVAKR